MTTPTVTSSTLNIQGLLTLISNAGSLTSEFAAFKSASAWGKFVIVLSAIVMLAGLVGSSFPNSRLAVIIGAAGTALGIVTNLLVTMHYNAGRQTMKQNAIQLLGAIQTAATAGQTLLTTLTIPAPAPAAATTAAPIPGPGAAPITNAKA